MTFVLRLVVALETLYMGMPLRLLGVRLLVWNELGSTLRRRRSNCLRKGGRDATRIPTESSVADQIVRFTPSQVGSLVFWRALNSTVLKMEHIVALGYCQQRCAKKERYVAHLHQAEAEY